MNFKEYQEATSRTANQNLTHNEKLQNWALGIAGEAGETIELVKKHIYHNKSLDKDTMAKEIGDILWYISEMCSANGLLLEDVAIANIMKLKARYPDKFVLGGGIRSNNNDADQDGN